MTTYRKYLCFIIAGLLCSLAACEDSAQHEDLTAVSGFGPNPGDLKMFLFEPSAPTADMPLVVAMHGCSQSAAQMADLTEWNRLAERYGFYVIYPEQRVKNNATRCFNWFRTDDMERDRGEARSVRSMVAHMLQQYPIDPQRVFVTGLSAGGAMTTAMLACYPDVFSAGAVFSGGPYKAATDVWQSASALAGNVSKSSQEWGDLVRAELPGFTGDYPQLVIFHGTGDPVVNEANASECVKQWTNVHGTDFMADLAIDAFAGAEDVQQTVYLNDESESVVVRYTISNMGHAVAVDPGPCRYQGGLNSSLAADKDFYSTWWAAQFFGIVPEMKVSGPETITPEQVGVDFSVPGAEGSSYAWTVPQGSTITAGSGTEAITVTWGTAPGTVTCTETEANGCVVEMQPIAVGF